MAEGPVWAQWVVDWTGATVWSHECPPKSSYAGMDPVLLPDANVYPGPVLQMPLAMRLRKPFNPATFPEKVEYEELTFLKARTTGDVKVWVEAEHYKRVQREYWDVARRA